MSDEATCYYEDFIDNMYIGHAFIKEHFGKTTNIGWQLDSFGHFSSTSSLFS